MLFYKDADMRQQDDTVYDLFAFIKEGSSLHSPKHLSPKGGKAGIGGRV